jgi:ribonuclease Z
MRYFLRVLQNNQRDMSTSLIFETEKNLYLFSCGDGLQRIASNFKMKFNRVKSIFLPTLSPSHFSGVPGFFLSTLETVAEADRENFKLALVGPPSLWSYLQTH